MTVSQNILNNWQEGDDPEMIQIAKEEEENVYKMFKECVEEENSGQSICSKMDLSLVLMINFFLSMLNGLLIVVKVYWIEGNF